MDRIPYELLAMVFSLACLDDGTMGRSLSLVSKYIHQVSKPVKFQSIALRGHHQILAFRTLLCATPERYRNVCHLFAYALNHNGGD
jgi:hypothetical protein